MDTDKYLLRNLEDAGFDQHSIDQFLHLQKDGKQKEQFQLLSKQRTLLLEKIHHDQHQIDCLDYLVYTMKHKTL